MNRSLFCLAALVACGGTSSALSQNSPGSGSGTLLVDADVTGSTSSGSQVTSFEVTVRDGLGNNVSGATVTVSNATLGDVPLVEGTVGSGRYTNSRASFPGGSFRLSVVRNADNVQGVVVGGPGVNTISAPIPNATVAANQPLALSWTTPTTAKGVLISTRDFDGQGPDTGAYTIPALSNPARTSQRLTLSRYNETDVAGGLSGSRLRVTFTSVVDPFVVQ